MYRRCVNVQALTTAVAVGGAQIKGPHIGSVCHHNAIALASHEPHK